MPCRELSGGAVNARSRVAVGAQRRGIDGAEYSAKMERVMAGVSDQGRNFSRHENVPSGSGWNALRIVSGIVAPFLRRFSVARET
jgi:hypothetical protein